MMLKLTDADNFRRTALGLSLIAAPLVGLVSAFITPRFTGGMGAELVAISEHTGRWLISGFLNLISFFLFMLAVLGIVHLLGHRSVILGHVGGGLVLLGAFFHGAIIGFALVEVPLVESGGPRDRMIEFVNQMYEGAAFMMILFPFLGFFLGWVLLAIALWRARAAPLWVAATLVVAPVSEFVGPEAVSPELMLALFLIALGYLGLKILRLSDRDWQRSDSPTLTPEVGPSRVA
jgi:hypothetical protein